MIAAIATLVPLALGAQADEAAHYAVDYLTPPDGAVLEVGGLDFLPDGRLAVSTRRGQVWLIENPLAENPADAKFSLFAEGLWEGLGLKVVDGEICVVQRGELSRLVDVDDDGVCDVIETITDDWGLSGNYHEFCYGLPVDAEGNFYITLNVAFFSPKWWHGKSPVPYRGWTLKISPDGVVTPFACGLRSPCGVSLDPEGRLFVTDNQGDWMAASPIFHVQEGGFYGHPASLDWTEQYRSTQTLASDTIPPARAGSDRKPAAIWLPYKWSRSPGNMAWDTTGGKFGPFEGQFFLAELTNGMILRGDFEEVNGELQGWVVPFRQKVGSAVRVAFAPDGTLFTGFTNRGWGGLSPADGIGRIRYTGTNPFEIADVKLRAVEGAPGTHAFEILLTRAARPARLKLAPGESLQARLEDFLPEVEVTQYDYDYWWEYGSPERATTVVSSSVALVPGVPRQLVVHVQDLRPGMVTRVRFSNLTAADGTPLLHPEFAYTVNQLPGGAVEGGGTTPHVSKIVPPPPARESGEEGWLRLSFGDATDRWIFEGWELVDAELDPEDPTRFKITEGNSALTNTAIATPSNYVSKPVFGDAKIHVEFLMPADSHSGVLVMGRYEIMLADGADCGSIIGGEGFATKPPELSAYRGPGLLHELDVEFQAPRFDADGNKIANARFVRVRIDDILLHENVELPGPSASALQGEVAEAALILRGDTGPVSFGNVRVFPMEEGEAEVAPENQEGWTRLLDFEAEDPLAGWHISEAGTWYVEDDVLIGEGPRSHLFSPRGDYTDFEIRARLKIADGGNSGLYFRAASVDEGWPPGYEAQINSSFADPQKTGSLYNFAPLKTHLIAPDTWFDYHVVCRDEPEGTHITIRVNGVLVTDYVDTERTHASGHIALQQHHDGSVIEVLSLEVRER